MQAYFARQHLELNTWIHAATCKPPDTRPELLGAVIASGSSLAPTGTVRRMGLAIQEVVRQAV
jgi:hypothetical protein